MNNVTPLVLLLASTLPAQVRLRYLDLGPQPTPCCMTTDAAGNTYVAASYTTSLANGFVQAKVVVYKINPTNGTVYRLIFGGSGYDSPTAIAADSNGSLFVVGSTFSSDFPLVKPLISNGPQPQSNGGDSRGFLSKISPTGTLVFSTFIGGLQSDVQSEVDAIALNSAGDVYITGETKATDFPITSGALANTGNAFVMKIANSGNHILLSTFIGPGGTGLALAVDSQGAITVAGSVWDNTFPATPGAFQPACNCVGVVGGLNPTSAYQSSFVSRLSADGSQLVWSTYLGGGGTGFASQDTVHALALTSDGGVVAAGTAESLNFPVTPGAFQTTLRAQGGYGPPANLFISRLNATGTALKFSTLLGGSVNEQFAGLQLDAQEHAWVTGPTASPDFPVAPHSLNLGNEFVAELSSDGSSLLSTRLYPYGAAGAAFAMDASGGQTLLGSAGSLIRIPRGALSKISLLAQLNAEAYVPSQRVAPGEAFTLIGTGLGPVHGVSAQPDSTGKYPTKLADVQVMCGGIAAPLLFVSTHQINAVIPFEISGKKSVLLEVVSSSKSTTPLKLLVVPAYPEIFSTPAGTPAALATHNAVAWNQDGSVNSASNPARQGSKITFWVNGVGLFTPALTDGAVVQSSSSVPVLPVSIVYSDEVLPDTQTIPATYTAGPGQVAGVLEVTGTIPQHIFAPNSALQVRVGDVVSDFVAIAVQ